MCVCILFRFAYKTNWRPRFIASLKRRTHTIRIMCVCLSNISASDLILNCIFCLFLWMQIFFGLELFDNPINRFIDHSKISSYFSIHFGNWTNHIRETHTKPNDRQKKNNEMQRKKAYRKNHKLMQTMATGQRKKKELVMSNENMKPKMNEKRGQLHTKIEKERNSNNQT